MRQNQKARQLMPQHVLAAHIHKKGAGTILPTQGSSADPWRAHFQRRLILAGTAFLLPAQPPLSRCQFLLASSARSAGTLKRCGGSYRIQTGCTTSYSFVLGAASEAREQVPLDGFVSDGSCDDCGIGAVSETSPSGDSPGSVSPEPPGRPSGPMRMILTLGRKLGKIYPARDLKEDVPPSRFVEGADVEEPKDDLIQERSVVNRGRLVFRLRLRWRERRQLRASRDPKPVAIAQGTPSGTLDTPTLPAWEQASEGKVDGSNARPSGVGIYQEDVGEGTADLGVTAITIDGVDVVVDPTCQDSGRTHQRGSEVALPSTSRARPEMYDGEEVSPETWEKVDELRRRAETCEPNSNDARGLQVWLGGGGEGREGLTDVDLLRFVMFRHGDVEAAWEQLKRAASWRQEQRVDEVLSEERWAQCKELQEEMFWIGRDTRGRATMVLRSIAHHPGRIDSGDFQRYFLYLLEQGRQLWGVGAIEQMNIVVDRVGAGMKNQDPRLLASMLPVFRDAYPDIVHRCYVAPTSWIFRLVWAIGARLVDDRQRKRVLLLLHEWQSRLLEDFDAGILPVHLGGTLKDYPPQQPPSSMRDGVRLLQVAVERRPKQKRRLIVQVIQTRCLDMVSEECLAKDRVTSAPRRLSEAAKNMLPRSICTRMPLNL